MRVDIWFILLVTSEYGAIVVFYLQYCITKLRSCVGVRPDPDG